MNPRKTAQNTHATAVPAVPAVAGPGNVRERYDLILPERDAAELLHVPMKTLRHWRQKGDLEGTYARRGHHVLYMTDRLVAHIFGGVA
jgi:hypothetical protein